jgi:hypothetical protein
VALGIIEQGLPLAEIFSYPHALELNGTSAPLHKHILIFQRRTAIQGGKKMNRYN